MDARKEIKRQRRLAIVMIVIWAFAGFAQIYDLASSEFQKRTIADWVTVCFSVVIIILQVIQLVVLKNKEKQIEE